MENTWQFWLYQWKSWIPCSFLHSPSEPFYKECEELYVFMWMYEVIVSLKIAQLGAAKIFV